MNIQEHIKKVLREEVGFIEKLKRLIPRKELSNEEKIINVIYKYVIPFFKLQSEKFINSNGEKTIIIRGFDSEGNRTVMKYYPDTKKLEYVWEFANKIHRMFPHKDLLHLDSKMIGQLFERLYNKRVNKVYGYQYLS
jgi:hypothetical protein